MDIGASSHVCVHIDSTTFVPDNNNDDDVSSMLRGHDVPGLAPCSMSSVPTADKNLPAALGVLLPAAAGVPGGDTGATPTQSATPSN